MTIQEGEKLTVLGFMVNPKAAASTGSSRPGAPAVLRVFEGEHVYFEKYYHFFMFDDGLEEPQVLVGPLTVQLTMMSDELEELLEEMREYDPTYSVGVCLSYRIDSTEEVPAANVITLPVISSGSWEVLMETSGDLKEWSAVTPGLFSPSEGAQFFRLRVVRED